MPTLATLTKADAIRHIQYWRTKLAEASEERDRVHAAERLDSWLETYADLSRLNP